MVFLLLGVIGVNGVPPYTGDAEKQKSVSLRTAIEHCLSSSPEGVLYGILQRWPRDYNCSPSLSTQMIGSTESVIWGPLVQVFCAWILFLEASYSLLTATPHVACALFRHLDFYCMLTHHELLIVCILKWPVACPETTEQVRLGS